MDEAGINEPVTHEPEPEVSLEPSWERGDAGVLQAGDSGAVVEIQDAEARWKLETHPVALCTTGRSGQRRAGDRAGQAAHAVWLWGQSTTRRFRKP